MGVSAARRHVVVTGAARGIGRAVAQAFRQLGDLVTAVDVEANDLTLDTGLRFLACDLAARADVERVADALACGEPVDVLVNNAGISLGGGATNTSLDAWDRTLAVNLTAPFILSQMVARAMVEQKRAGNVVMVSSVNAFGAEHGALSYVVSKHALLGLTRALAVELAPYGVRVNGVAPGPIRTESHAQMFDEPHYRSGIERGVPMGRAGSAEEVARAVVALTDPGLSYVTGSTLLVDGGFRSYIRLD